MAMTEFRLIKAPLFPDQPHTIYFEKPQAQTDYFNTLTQKRFYDFTYQRKDGVVRLPVHFDEAVHYNYCMYKNPQHDKWYYAFVIDTKYVDEGRTDITIDTDVLQTFMFNYDIDPCYIARQHCRDDSKGKHTLPENLEKGEYIVNNVLPYYPLTRDYCFVVGATVDILSDNMKPVSGEIYNNVYSGVAYYVFWIAGGLEHIINVLNSSATLTNTTAITSIFMVPSEMLNLVPPTDLETRMKGQKLTSTTTTATASWNTTNKKYNASYTGSNEVLTLTKPKNLDGYVPKNNKLFTYPYTYLLMDNNAGGSAVYEYEKFKWDNPDFSISYSVTPGGSLRIAPMNYNYSSEDYTYSTDLYGNNSEGLTGGKFPICSWATDVYTNWLTQNSLNFEVREKQIQLNQTQAITNQALNLVGSVVNGFANPTPIGVVSAGVGAISSATNGVFAYEQGQLSIEAMNAEKFAHSLQPPTISGNLNSGDVTFSKKCLTFTAYQMTIKKEYAKIIDEYFSMFGYACQRVMKPYENHRAYYWYLKTVNCNIKNYTLLSAPDVLKLRKIFNAGITFWTMKAVNENKFMNYNCDNAITKPITDTDRNNGIDW